MGIRIVKLGSPRAADEGVRIGTVRRPPRGVPKEQFSSRDYYDTWLPNLSPSAALMTQGRTAQTDAEWRKFVQGYRKEMQQPEASHVLDLLATLSHGADFSVGCYCEEEGRCHRSILRELLAARGAAMVG